MKVQKLNESLQQIAYMIDRKGKSHVGVKDKHMGYIHPFIYIPQDKEMDNLIDQTIKCMDDFVWYYSNTSDTEIKDKIRENMLFLWYSNSSVVDSKFPDDSFQDVDDIGMSEFINNYIDIAMGLNQEFLPCRYGGEYMANGEHGAIYFRVTSTGFNWFNIIWEFVYNNKSSIDTITIERDKSRTGSSEIYHHGRHTFNHMPIDEFIMLQGNPIIESLSTYKDNRFIYENDIYNKLAEGFMPHDIIEGNPIFKIKMFNIIQKMENMEI